MEHFVTAIEAAGSTPTGGANATTGRRSRSAAEHSPAGAASGVGEAPSPTGWWILSAAAELTVVHSALVSELVWLP